MKKALLALLMLPAMGAIAFGQTTAAQSVLGYTIQTGQSAGGVTCDKGPCFVPYGTTLPVSGAVSTSVSGFQPSGAVANLVVTSASSSVALPANTGTVLVTNTGTTVANVKLSVGAGSAATTDLALVPGAAVGLTVGANTFLNGITASGSTSLSIAGGSGLVGGFGGGGSAATSVVTYTTTDKGGTLTTGGTAQTAIASNASRKIWCIQNDPNANEMLFVRVNGTASLTTGVGLPAGQEACSTTIVDTSAVSVIAATTGHRWFGFEGQ
jgi:hypothetical protein